MPLAFLSRFNGLKSLSLSGQRPGVEVLKDLPSLKSLEVYNLTVADPTLLEHLTSLEGIAIQHGSTADLSVLGRLYSIEQVTLWKVKGLEDLNWLSELPELRTLKLGAMGKISGLPTFHDAENLKFIKLEQMKGLACIADLAKAPNLEQLDPLKMSHIPLESFGAFKDHPSLKAVSSGYSSKKKRQAVAELLELPIVTYTPYASLNHF